MTVRGRSSDPAVGMASPELSAANIQIPARLHFILDRGQPALGSPVRIVSQQYTDRTRRTVHALRNLVLRRTSGCAFLYQSQRRPNEMTAILLHAVYYVGSPNGNKLRS